MRIGTASARRRAQLLALEPTLSIEPLRGNIDTRLRKRGERGLDAIVLAACGLDRLGPRRRDRPALRPGRDAAGGGPGRACAAGARRRGGARRRRRRCRDAPPGRGGAALRRGSSAAAASRPSPPTTTASRCTALVAAEDGTLDRAASRRRPARSGASSPLARDDVDAGSPRRPRDALRAHLGTDLAQTGTPSSIPSASPGGRGLGMGGTRGAHRRHASARPGDELVARLAALGHEAVHCPLIAIEPLGDEPVDVDGLRLGRRHERERRPRAAAPDVGAAARGSPRSAGRPPTRFGGADLVAARLDAGRPARRAAAPGRAGCCSRRAEGARRLLADELDADVVAALPDARARARRVARTRDLVVLASPSAARALAAPRHERSPRCRSGRRRRARRARPGSSSRPRPTTHDLDGLVAAVERALAQTR